jgi:hypothetical protein
MADAKDELVTMMMLGQMAKEMFQARQAEFDRSNPSMNEAESQAADLVQSGMQRIFNRRLEELKKEGKDFKGMDVLELRLWAPDVQCVLMQLHDYLTEEYGLFHHIALSSGIIPLAKNKLFYISLVIRKMKDEDLFGGKDGTERRKAGKTE